MARPVDHEAQRVLSSVRTILTRLQTEIVAANPKGENETGEQEVRDALAALIQDPLADDGAACRTAAAILMASDRRLEAQNANRRIRRRKDDPESQNDQPASLDGFSINGGSF